MSELEDRINSILSSPEEMEKIMGIARSLSGSLGAQEGTEAAVSAPSGALEGIDPKLMGVIGRLMGQFGSAQDDKTALLNAMKPFLKPERAEAVDRAAKIAKLAHIARLALHDGSGGESTV